MPFNPKRDPRVGVQPRGAPSLDYAKAEKEILDFIRRTILNAGSRGAVVGLSGGIDSSVAGALLVKALGKDRVIGILMPASHTPREDIDDARKLAMSWGIRTYEIEIDSIFSAFEASLPKVGGNKIAYANVKARIRMIINYYVANCNGMLVAGTGDRSEDSLGYFCYDEKTRVVTAEGPKDLHDLRAWDSVFSIDPATQRMVKTRVEEVHRFPYAGTMIHFGGRSADLMVTPNHRMLIHTGSSGGSRLIFRRADRCLEFRDIIAPVPVGWSGGAESPREIELRFEQRHIRRRVRLSIQDAFYLLGLFIADGRVVRGRVAVPVKSRLSRLDYQASYRGVTGRFAPIDSAGGELRLKEYETFGTVFALPDHTRDPARQNLMDILTKHRIGYSVTGGTVSISSRGLYEFFQQCGADAKSKHIPEWVLDQRSEHLIHLLRGLRDGDGAHRDAGSRYHTSSAALKDGFVQLCFKLGRRASVTYDRPRSPVLKDGKRIESGPSFTVTYSSRPRPRHTIKSRHAEIVDYQGEVWCPSVPPFENVLVERNGKYFFSGNTKYGDGGVDFLPIAHLYKTQVRELGAHLGLPRRLVEKPSSPQLWPGHKATDEIPIDYDRLDPVLVGLLDQKLPPKEVSRRTRVDLKIVEDVVRRYQKSEHKRAYPPMIGGW